MRPKPERLLDYREYPILYVDDEPENLRIFELTFRREFAILTARSGERGPRAPPARSRWRSCSPITACRA